MRESVRKFSIPLIIVIVTVLAIPAALRAETLDQANNPTWTGEAVNIVPANAVSQNFVPALPLLTVVEVALKTGNTGHGGDQVTLKILNASGEELASSTAAIVEGFDGFQRFDLTSGGISVTPGQTLTLRLQDTGKSVFWWKYVGGNPYPAGQAMFYGSPFRDNDFLFKTYGENARCGKEEAPCCGGRCQPNLTCIERPDLYPHGICKRGLHPYTAKAREGFSEITDAQRTLLRELRTSIRHWAGNNLCGAITVSEPPWEDPPRGYLCPYVTGKFDCHDVIGDGGQIGGLLCASGEDYLCNGVRDAQDSSGRWWRSPLHFNPALNGRNCDKHSYPDIQTSYSRDHAVGALLYLVTSLDVEAAKRWWRYIVSQDLKICPDAPFGASILGEFCTLDTYDGLFGQFPHLPFQNSSFRSSLEVTWKYLGLEVPRELGTVDKDRARRDLRTHACQQYTIPFKPGEQGKPWRIHVDASNIFLHQIYGEYLDPSSAIESEAIDCVYNTDHQNNPFFRFLKEGASSEVARLTLDVCGNPDLEKNSLYQSNWKWGRLEYGDRPPLGTDCIFMINLLLGPDPDAKAPHGGYGCKQKTCEEIGAQCGAIKNGCGGYRDCGGCSNGDRCFNHKCCKQKTCEEIGAQCGAIENGCGGYRDCGGCSNVDRCINHKCVSPQPCPRGKKCCEPVDGGCAHCVPIQADCP